MQIYEREADCDICGIVKGAATMARTMPVGRSWVGGKESYKSCCSNCFHEASVFHNPAITLAAP